jgi:hypothetical protein
MRFPAYCRYALSITVATALLPGCGGSQPMIGAPGAMPRSRAIATHADRSGSWMAPGASSEDLLYVSKLKNVLVYSYPAGKVVGNIAGFDYASGLCSDASGDVWVTDSQKSTITEYAHAGTKPIASLSDENQPVGCAVDPRSGGLAVANYADNVFVYPRDRSTPVVYTAPDFYFMEYCGYDANGNLFVTGWRARRKLVVPSVLKLSYGSPGLLRFKLGVRRRKYLHSAGAVEWDGESLVVGWAGKSDNVLYRVSDSGSIGEVTKQIELTVPDGGYIPGNYQFWLYGSTLIAPYEVYPEQYYIALWPYPDGGTAVKKFKVQGKFFPAGLTVSVAPK